MYRRSIPGRLTNSTPYGVWNCRAVPLALQRVCGSSSWICRASYSARAQGWNGVCSAGLMGSVMPNRGVHTPFSSGVAPQRIARPSASRGAGPGGGAFGSRPRRCAAAGSAMTTAATGNTDANTVSFMSSLRYEPGPARLRGLVTLAAARIGVERLAGPAARSRERHGSGVHAVLAVARHEAVDGDGLTDLERLATPAAALQAMRR